MRVPAPTRRGSGRRGGPDAGGLGDPRGPPPPQRLTLSAYILSARRGGRVVECAGLENRRRGNSSAGSNPAPSAVDVACLLGFSMVVAAEFGAAGDRLTPLKLAQ